MDQVSTRNIKKYFKVVNLLKTHEENALKVAATLMLVRRSTLGNTPMKMFQLQKLRQIRTPSYLLDMRNKIQ